MQKTRKLLSLLLVVVFALAMMVPTASAARFNDVPETYRYYDAVENLAARGIINGMGDGSYSPDANVKRDEFAKIVCIGILGTGEIAPADGAGFTDVAGDRWSSGYIKVAAAAGIINGMGDGTFAPENPVTYEQAVKMLVCALGYEAPALARGGYPDGYLNTAGGLGLLKGVVDGAKGVAANRGLIAKLVDNALDVEIVDPLTGKTTGSIKDNDNQQNVKGQVIAVPGSIIYYGEKNPCGKKQILIENGDEREIYSIENLSIDNINEYLGKMVVAYYEEDNSVDYYELSSLSLQKNANDITEINLDMIYDYSNSLIEYLPDEDGDYEDVSVSEDAIIMYNGVAVDPDTNTLSDLLDKNIENSGSITLLDSEGSGTADIVFLKVYDTILVSSITKSEYKVYNEITGGTPSIVLDETDRSKKITFTQNGKAAEFSDIAKGEVLSIAASEDGKVIDVLITPSASKSGTVDEIGDGGNSVKIDNKEYKVAKSFAEKAEDLFEIDSAVTIYIDAFGKIVYAKANENASAYTYAYLTGVQKEGSTSEVVYVQLYDIKTGSKLAVKRFELDENIRINNESFKGDADGVLARLKQSATELNQGNAATGAGEYTQVIKYSTKDAKINKIIVYEDGVKDVGNQNVLNVDNLNAGGLNVTGTGMIGSYTLSSAVSLIIPKDNRISGEYSGKAASAYKVGQTVKVQIIDASATGIVKAVLVYGEDDLGQASIEGAAPVIVTGISRGTQQIDGETVSVNILRVKGSDGNEKTYYADDNITYKVLQGRNSNLWSTDLEFPAGDGYFNGLAVGDIVKITADAENMIDELMIVVDTDKVLSGKQAAAIATEGENGDSANAQYRYFLGTVRAVDMSDGNDLQITPQYAVDGALSADIASETYDNVGDSICIYVVDTTKTNEDKIVSEGIFESINDEKFEQTYPKLFVYQNNKAIKMIVIFK